jgi:hypothetical protein
MLLKKDFEGVSEQFLFKTSIGRARSIQESSAHDSIVARRQHAADFFNSIGQTQRSSLAPSGGPDLRSTSLTGTRFAKFSEPTLRQASFFLPDFCNKICHARTSAAQTTPVGSRP